MESGCRGFEPCRACQLKPCNIDYYKVFYFYDFILAYSFGLLLQKNNKREDVIPLSYKALIVIFIMHVSL